MFVVMDSLGNEYACGDVPGQALNAAVRKFSADRRKRMARAIWEDMRDRHGFRIVEPILFPFPFKDSPPIGPG